MIVATRRPRLGFLGLGWIGRTRMQAVAESGIAEIVALADASPEARSQAQKLAPSARACSSAQELFESELDGLVIATPSAQHAPEAIAALERGLAVFCQKPLARNAQETETVVRCAQHADKLLHVDFSYRHTRALTCLKALLDSRELGTIYTGRFVFHNAYGPAKDWYNQRVMSGGGCMMDLGIHLVDLAFWLLGAQRATCRHKRLYAQGRPLSMPSDVVEDYAAIELELDDGRAVEIACSWRLPLGRDASIRVELWGAQGGAVFRNVDGSFYDFVAERTRGTSCELLCAPPDAWGGRAIVAWVRALAASRGYSDEAQHYVSVARVIDQAYGI
jgi:predicted dehydrogenase